MNEPNSLTDLQLTVQRLVDADLMLEEEAEPLLSEIEATLSSAEGADRRAICRLVDRCGRPAVVRTPHLEPAGDRNSPAAGPDPAP